MRVRVPPCPEDNNTSRIFKFRNKPIRDIRTAFKNACTNAGIKSLRFHDLRHTFATRLVQLGVDIVSVSRLLGHTSIQMTMRYNHPSPDTLKSAVTALDKE